MMQQMLRMRKRGLWAKSGWVAGLRARFRFGLIFFVTFFHLRKESKNTSN